MGHLAQQYEFACLLSTKDGGKRIIFSAALRGGTNEIDSFIEAEAKKLKKALGSNFIEYKISTAIRRRLQSG